MFERILVLAGGGVLPRLMRQPTSFGGQFVFALAFALTERPLWVALSAACPSIQTFIYSVSS